MGTALREDVPPALQKETNRVTNQRQPRRYDKSNRWGAKTCIVTQMKGQLKCLRFTRYGAAPVDITQPAGRQQGRAKEAGGEGGRRHTESTCKSDGKTYKAGRQRDKQAPKRRREKGQNEHNTLHSRTRRSKTRNLKKVETGVEEACAHKQQQPNQQGAASHKEPRAGGGRRLHRQRRRSWKGETSRGDRANPDDTS